MDDRPVTLARDDGVTGEVVLRRRATTEGDVHELIVNGIFLMDTAETSTERLLAEALSSQHPRPRTVLVGGLGLGFTVAALLADARVERVVVAEIEALLPRWLADGLVPGADHVLSDPRVEIVVDDVGTVLAQTRPGGYDGILLDVDNGPDFLVREENAAVYEPAALSAAARALAPGGVLAVWSAAPSPTLFEVLATVVGPAEEITRSVEREGRQITYHVLAATKPTRAHERPDDPS